MQARKEHFSVRHDEGKSVWLGPGLGVVFKISGEDTGGAFSLVEHPIKPGTIVPPHTHTREDETSFVIEGEMGARIGDKILTATPGTYVFKPRNVPHTFWNAGTKTTRIIEIISPSGFAKYFEEMAELVPAGGPPDFDKVDKLARQYGLSFHMDWLPELTAKYKLKLLGNE